jgi:tRNA(Ile2)-agmatinylcytidine synthase
VAVIGIDDTDSRERGMCTTYVATRVAERLLAAGASVHRRLLVRLNPAVERKTRGNAALAVHTDASAEHAYDVATDVVGEFAAVENDGETADDGTTNADRTSPGVVVADCSPEAVPEAVVDYTRAALRRIHELPDALALAEEAGFRHAAVTPTDASGAGATDHPGYGRIGALAAVGAWAAFETWTHEHIAYRELDRCGTERAVDADSVFAAADEGYPTVWDTVDSVEGETVCVPNAPGPILYGIRGDDPDACRAVAERIESEPVDRAATFLTNQGTDAHVTPGGIGALRDGAGYVVDGVVSTPPETRRGGHVFFGLAHPDDALADPLTGEFDDGARTVDCVAFEPTKRFRDRVRPLRVGDELTVVGEHDDGAMKLEKVAVRSLVREELTTPNCGECGRTMESAGRDQGYRCRECETSAAGRARRALDRDLEVGWYEVPPCARRHVAKPLVRGGFDAPVHPER